METELLSQISQFGFPIIVAMYSLTRLEKTMKDNTEVMTKLIEKLGGIE